MNRRTLLVIALAADVLPPQGMTVMVMPSPDADLIADCVAFNVLERAIYITCLGDDCPIKEAEGERLRDEQTPIVARICARPARTMAGLEAKVRSLILCDEDAIDESAFSTHDLLRSSLLSDLLSMPDGLT